MTELNPYHLLTVIDEATLKKIWRFCKGARIYFPANAIEYEEIRSFVAKKRAEGVTMADAVEEAARRFEKSERRIRKIVKTVEKRFGENPPT